MDVAGGKSGSSPPRLAPIHRPGLTFDTMTLADLTQRLDDFASARTSHAELQEWFDALLAADTLGAERNDSAPWDAAPDETRLFWRLVYLFESDEKEGDEETGEGSGGESPRRRFARRVVDCVSSTGSAATTLELLPILRDQDRFCAIVGKHVRHVISRTGYLSVLAESGYPAHIKLWLEHAEPAHLERLCERLSRAEYSEVASGFESRPR